MRTAVTFLFVLCAGPAAALTCTPRFEHGVFYCETEPKPHAGAYVWTYLETELALSHLADEFGRPTWRAIATCVASRSPPVNVGGLPSQDVIPANLTVTIYDEGILVVPSIRSTTIECRTPNTNPMLAQQQAQPDYWFGDYAAVGGYASDPYGGDWYYGLPGYYGGDVFAYDPYGSSGSECLLEMYGVCAVPADYFSW